MVSLQPWIFKVYIVHRGYNSPHEESREEVPVKIMFIVLKGMFKFIKSLPF